MAALPKCLAMISVIVVAVGVAMKVGFAKFVRFDVIAPEPPALTPIEMDRAVRRMNLLCVGCTAGIGEAAARAVCRRGGYVVVLGRHEPSSLLADCGHNIEFVQSDLSSMKTARNIARKFGGGARKFDTVLFTVGIICGKERKVSIEGVEMDTAVSFLSRFVMSQELISSAGLASVPSRRPRIFIMGFPGTPDIPQLDDFNWDTIPFACWPAHKNGVVGNDALVLGLSRRHPEVNVYGLNPGIIKTGIMNDFLGGKGTFIVALQQFIIGTINPSTTDYAEGALLLLLVTPHLEERSGTFFNQGGQQIQPSTWLLSSDDNAERLWIEAEKLVARALSVSMS